jgi:hypothetical protein
MLWIPKSAPAEDASEEGAPGEGDVDAADPDPVPEFESLLNKSEPKVVFSH